MIHFTKNTGQFHQTVAYVAVWPDHLPYPGAGPVRLILDGVSLVGAEGYGDRPMTEDLRGIVLDDGTTIPWHDEITPAELDELIPGTAHAMVSGHEIVVLRGTAAAALLNLAGDHS